MDSNSWFYTLSAIPQTLAAMFALVIAVFVFRTEELNKLIARDINDSKKFLLPIFDNLEIHEIEAMTGKEYLRKIEGAVENILKKDSPNLGMDEGKYDRLRLLYKTKIAEYERGYSPDENRIFKYLQVKKDSIKTHILSGNAIEICFFILIIITSLMIFLSLYYLPRFSPCLVGRFQSIHIFAIVNIFAIAAGVIFMVFTKRFLKFLGFKVI